MKVLGEVVHYGVKKNPLSGKLSGHCDLQELSFSNATHFIREDLVRQMSL
jgi:hypothetical protein